MTYDSMSSIPQYCGNCGHLITDPKIRSCEKCRAPLDDSIRAELLTRNEPILNGKCWQCGGTTSGNICGICGAPLTKVGLELNKTYISEIQPEIVDSIGVISPKDRAIKKILVSFDEES